jgi:predicted DNA-binding transcriptional regulator AlpA
MSKSSSARAEDATPVRPLLVRYPAVYCGIPQHTFEKLMRAGAVPPPVDLPGRALWRTADLDQWIANLQPRRKHQQPGGATHA